MQVFAASTPHAAELAAGRGTRGEWGDAGAGSTCKFKDPGDFPVPVAKKFQPLLRTGHDSPAGAAMVKGKGHLSRGSPEASLEPASRGR